MEYLGGGSCLDLVNLDELPLLGSSAKSDS